jgi:CubicO group peptidase (beta-lactamase class C family)
LGEREDMIRTASWCRPDRLHLTGRIPNVNVVLDPGALGYPAGRGEYGWDGSAGTIFWIDPAKAMITMLMTQSVPANPDSLRQRFKTLVEQALISSSSVSHSNFEKSIGGRTIGVPPRCMKTGRTS